jgi:hypothetical protein
VVARPFRLEIRPAAGRHLRGPLRGVNQTAARRKAHRPECGPTTLRQPAARHINPDRLCSNRSSWSGELCRAGCCAGRRAKIEGKTSEKPNDARYRHYPDRASPVRRPQNRAKNHGRLGTPRRKRADNHIGASARWRRAERAVPQCSERGGRTCKQQRKYKREAQPQCGRL